MNCILLQLILGKTFVRLLSVDVKQQAPRTTVYASARGVGLLGYYGSFRVESRLVFEWHSRGRPIREDFASHIRTAKALAIRLARHARTCGTGGTGQLLLRPLEQRYHFRAGFQRIEIIRPRLHHFAPLRQVLSKVVSRAHCVALGVRELALDGLKLGHYFIFFKA